MILPAGVELRIERELGSNALRIIAYKYKAVAAILIGYKNHRNKTVKCYPKKIVIRGAFSESDLPIECRIDEIPWEKR